MTERPSLSQSVRSRASFCEDSSKQVVRMKTSRATASLPTHPHPFRAAPAPQGPGEGGGKEEHGSVIVVV